MRDSNFDGEIKLDLSTSTAETSPLPGLNVRQYALSALFDRW